MRCGVSSGCCRTRSSKDHELTAVDLTVELKITIGGSSEDIQVQQTLNTCIQRGCCRDRLSEDATCESS